MKNSLLSETKSERVLFVVNKTKKKIAIVGVGFQGEKYARYFFDGCFEDAELVAICDLFEERMNKVDPQRKTNHYTDYHNLFAEENLDAVIINTPHYTHPEIALAAVNNNFSVLCDKPLGVYAKSLEQLKESIESHPITFGVLFNQRMDPVFMRIKQIIQSGTLGTLKRCVWEVTDWYRPQKYYDLGGWRSNWEGEGGGVLINQCVHNIDMLYYLFGYPQRIQSLIGYGAYHDTEVDDSVIANLIFENSFLCTFISSTGETPGTNRFELSGSKGKLIMDDFSKLKFTINEVDEAEYAINAHTPPNKIKFGKPKTLYYEEPFNERVDLHMMCIQNFIDAMSNGKEPVAGFGDGVACVEIVNGMYYADWVNSTVDLPVDEEVFCELLQSRFS